MVGHFFPECVPDRGLRRAQVDRANLKNTHTAAKCNFCAHRIDDGLEPACVVVCPTHSIWIGDLDDPTSVIARLVSSNPESLASR
jgi:Fe-S-cluster-containing dehydrogenase component